MAAQAITAQDTRALSGRTYPELDSRVPSLPALLRRLRTWYDAHRRYRQTVFELSRLSDHLLADLGIGRHQIEEIARALSRRAG